MAQANTPGVMVRGTRDGVSISMGSGEWDDLLARLTERLYSTASFFAGSRVTLEVGDRALSAGQIRELEDVLNRHDMGLYAVAANLPETRAAAREVGLRAVAVDVPGHLAAQGDDAQAETGNALLVRRTIRSGQAIQYSGHVVIVGDVNPGGEVVAGGDVVVWGRLRGVVHAGAVGDDGAIVCALQMRPMQLRIGNHIARAPEDQGRSPAGPEMAYVRRGVIVAEPWDQVVLGT